MLPEMPKITSNAGLNWDNSMIKNIKLNQGHGKHKKLGGRYQCDANMVSLMCNLTWSKAT
ncbi:MAG: hypothetical protein ACJAWL_003439 [Motiliproteus sp.]|jgi:hypothetical protein